MSLKKILTFTLAIALLLNLFPVSALANENTQTAIDLYRATNSSLDLEKLEFDNDVLSIYFLDDYSNQEDDVFSKVETSFRNLKEILENEEAEISEYKIFINGKRLEAVVHNEATTNNTQEILNSTGLKDDGTFDVVINPGHGWYHYNNSEWRLQRPTINGIVEDFVNMDFGVKLANKLESQNIAKVHGTRDLYSTGGTHSSGYPMWQMSSTDYLKSQGYPAEVWDGYRGSAYDQNMGNDLRARGLFGNYINADAMVSIHNNGGGHCGTETYYDTYYGYQFYGQRLAELIQTKLVSKLRAEWNPNWCDRGVKATDGGYAETRIFRGPAVLVEIGFMDNISDNNAIQNPTFQEIVTEAMKEAIAEYKTFPLAEIRYPKSDTVLPIQESHVFEVDAVDFNGSISKVEFYIDDVLVGEDTTKPYQYNFTNVEQGSVQLRAVAVDNSGNRGTTRNVVVNFSDYYGITQERLIENFGLIAGGWTVSQHVRTTGDINGDGKADAVGFAHSGVHVAMSNGREGFNPAQVLLSDFGVNQGWNNANHVRTVADVDGDGKDDIVGFGHNGIFVAFSTGNGFTPAQQLLTGLGLNQGWSVNNHTRTMGDVDGDGKADAVAFGNDGVYVAFSNGRGQFETPVKLTSSYANNNGWTNANDVRTVADINGDGKADIAAFNQSGVYVSFSNGRSNFAGASLISGAFANQNGWQNSKHVRTFADVDGDGKDDIIGFGDKGTFVAFSTGTGFSKASYLIYTFGAAYSAGSWLTTNNPRTADDVDGDGRADLIGFGDSGIWVSFIDRTDGTEPTPPEDQPCFSDVPLDHPFQQFICALKNDNIVGGYPDGTYKPTRNVTRGEMAVFIQRAFGIPTNTDCKEFIDMTTSTAFYAEAMSLRCAGIIGGYGDGSYRPTGLVSRGEMAVFIQRAANYNGANKIPNNILCESFKDMKLGSDFYTEAMSLRCNNVISGYPDGTYKPGNPVNRGEMAVFVDKARKV